MNDNTTSPSGFSQSSLGCTYLQKDGEAGVFYLLFFFSCPLFVSVRKKEEITKTMKMKYLPEIATKEYR